MAVVARVTAPVAPAPFEVDFDAIAALPVEEQKAALAAVARINESVGANPMWRYVPHRGELGRKVKDGVPLDGSEQRGQEQFHEMNLAGVETGAYVAGNRAGKTEVGVRDALIQTLPKAMLPPWLHKYKVYDDEYEYRCRVIGTDLGQWFAKAIIPKLRAAIPPAALWKGSFDRSLNERTRLLQFADGSWWDFLTHDMELLAFASVDVDRVWFDEEPPGERGRQQVDESAGRIVDRDGDTRWTLTPLQGLNHVYYDLTDAAGNPRCDDEVMVVQGEIHDNPHISERGKRKFLRRFAKDPLKLEARERGRWVHFAGLIYPEWNQNRHVAPDAPVPRLHENAVPIVPIYAAIDPGINKDHRTGLVFGWLGHDDVAQVFHSRKFEDGATVEDVAGYYHEVCASLAFKPRWTSIDPSAQNRNHATGRSIQDEYRKHRIHTTPAQNSRELGFNAIKERLRSDRLVVHASNVDLIQQFEEYRWKSSQSRSEDAPKPEPVKRNDDLMDAIRFFVVQLPKAPANAEEWERKDLSDADRAFRSKLKRLGRRGRRRGRIGGVVPG